MNAKDIHNALSDLQYHLRYKGELSFHENELLEAVERLFSKSDAGFLLTVQERTEALLAIKGVTFFDLTDLDKRREVDEAIGYAYYNNKYISQTAFAEMLGIRAYRVCNAYHDYINKKAALID